MVHQSALSCRKLVSSAYWRSLSGTTRSEYGRGDQALGIVVLDRVHPRRDRRPDEIILPHRPQQLHQRIRRLASVEPIVDRLLLEDHRHPVVDRLQERVRSRRDDRERPLLLGRGGPPRLVQAREQDQPAVGTMEPGRPPVLLRAGPLEDPSAGTAPRREANASRNAGDRRTVSARALMFLNACLPVLSSAEGTSGAPWPSPSRSPRVAPSWERIEGSTSSDAPFRSLVGAPIQPAPSGRHASSRGRAAETGVGPECDEIETPSRAWMQVSQRPNRRRR